MERGKCAGGYPLDGMNLCERCGALSNQVCHAHYQQLHSALAALVEALEVNDEDGLTAFAPQMEAARAALR